MAIKVTKHPKEGYKFIPMSERGEEQPFTAWLRPIGAKALSELEDSLVQRKGADAMIFTQNTFEYRLVQLGLVDWDNVYDENNQKVSLKKNADGVVVEDLLDPLPQQIIKEMAMVISSITRDPSTIKDFFSDEGDKKSLEPSDTATTVSK